MEQKKKSFIEMDYREFDQHLMQNYPGLFDKDAEGNPVDPECGMSCPPGWREPVDNLCGVLHGRRMNHKACVPNPAFKVLLKRQVFRFLVSPVLEALYQVFESRNKKIRKWLSHLRFHQYWRKDSHLFVPTSENLRIGQIKEKFGGLRFYYDGGDDVTSGMVQLTEHICGKLCMHTGQPGKLTNIGGWYRTLSEEELNKLKDKKKQSNI